MERTIGRVDVQFNAWAINRTRLKWYWYDETRGYLCLEHGNGNSDPVWSLDVRVTPRSLMARRLLQKINA